MPQPFDQGGPGNVGRFHVDDERAVVLGLLGGRGDREPGPGFVPDIFDDFGDGYGLARRELAEDEVRAGLFFLFLGLFGRLFFFLGRFHGRFFRRRFFFLGDLRLGLLLRLVFFLGLLRQRSFQQISDERRRFLGDLETLDAFHGRDFARRQVQNAEAVFGLFLGFLFVLLGLVDVGFDRSDRKDDEFRVDGDDRRLAPGLAIFLIRFQVADDELAVPVLGREDISQPRPVAGNLRALDRPPRS